MVDWDVCFNLTYPAINQVTSLKHKAFKTGRYFHPFNLYSTFYKHLIETKTHNIQLEFGIFWN